MANRLSRLIKPFTLGLAAALLIGGSRSPKVGDIAPPFEITLVDGTKIKSEELRGSVVVLNYWATWCVPCREELPLLDRYYDLQRKNGLKVYAITTEGSLPLFQLKKLFAVMKIPAARKINGPYGNVRAVPTNYIIDRAGRIRYAKAAAFTLDGLNAELVPLLSEPVPQS
ncbi:TlpA family protein disulfide reductase [Sphingomonas sp. GB1N7]|uniref:TlpA family protein disulfide reductase n=1 Tax=Parasphingomonas caseinilytica TaxID=3096158 RepID=UPI002FC83411